MSIFQTMFYVTIAGDCPTKRFLDALAPKMRAKMIGLIEILQEHGNSLREPYSKSLEDGIFELRCSLGSDCSRILYFFYHDNRIILLNGFIKKTNKTPREEIKRAKKLRTEFLAREDKYD